MSDAKIKPDDILYSPCLVQQQRNGVYLLIDPEAPNWASVNAAGSAIIRACDGHKTMNEITSASSSQSGIETDEIIGFINTAAEAGFISRSPNLTPAYTGRAGAISPAQLEEIWINTNNSCPLRCRHCLVNGGTEASAPMDTAQIKTVVDQAIDLGAHRIYFTGGEPFLRRDLLPLVQYVTERSQLVILTSGVLVTDDTAKQLAAAAKGNLLMQVSLDGPDAATSDSLRGEGNFERAVTGIRRLTAAGLTPIVTTTLTKLNYRQAAETTRFLATLGVRDHHILWLHGRGRMRGNTAELTVPGAEVSRVMEELRQTADGMNIIVDNTESLAVRVRGKRGRKNDLCNSGYGIMSINADGRVYPCAALAGADGFDCGSIKEQSLRDIWLNSPTANWIRQNSVQKRVGCSSCHLKFFCGGGCFAQSYFDYEIATGQGCIMAPDPYCEAYSTQITELMWQMAMPEKREKTGHKPALYRNMENTLPGCAISGNKTLDAAFDIGTYHCSCVLAIDANKEER